MMVPQLLCFGGIALVITLAYALSVDRSAISWRYGLSRLLLLALWAVALVKTPFGAYLLAGLENVTMAIQHAAQQGISFVFGDLGSSQYVWGFVFAIQVLPIIIFFSALVSILTYLRVIQTVVYGIGTVLQPILGTTGPETACAIAKSFLGLMEGPLVVRAYFDRLNRSELFTIMTAALGMASASLIPVYISYGASAKHLIAANLMGIIAVIFIAKIIVPEEKVKAAEVKSFKDDQEPSNMMDALLKGTGDGLTIVLNIAALLISFIALVALVNNLLFTMEQFVGLPRIGLQDIVGYFFWPFSYLFGVESADVFNLSRLLGVKVTTNEMLAFAEVATHQLSARALTLATYALCGFGNIAGMGIIVGGLGTLMPDKRALLSALSWRALIAATLANLLSAYIVGVIL